VSRSQPPRRPGARLATLDRALSKSGVASRAEARRWIAAGRAKVNGRACDDPDRWVDLDRDRIFLDGRPLQPAPRLYLALHKPRGVLTTRVDPQGRPTVFDLLPPSGRYLFTVGRLDLDSSGLLLLTNDGRFADHVAGPEHGVPKTYVVKVSRRLSDGELERLRRGIDLRDGPTRPAEVRRLRDPGGHTVFKIILSEGRNRQVRRMVEALGADVIRLERTAIGPLRLEDLPPGKARPLTPGEVRALLSSAAATGRASSRR
jgi:pseudouridine synthase